MPTQREVVVEQDICEEAEAEGYIVRKMQYVGRRNCPDRWFLRDGVWTIIEFKRRGEVPNPTQAREHDKLRSKGQKIHAIDNHEDARRLLKIGVFALLAQ